MDDRLPTLDALLPAQMALRMEEAGVAKAKAPWRSTLPLAVLAGAFIALGAVFFTVAVTGAAESGLPWGLTRVFGGLCFCLGLIAVIVGGAELFTGNNLIVMAFASRRVGLPAMLRNWTLVYAGNFIGAVGTALLVHWSGLHYAHGGAVGRKALDIALAKCALGFGSAVALGVLCNTLVCLAVWLCASARTTTDKILCVLFPITAFVAAGFEHVIANFYFVPAAWLVRHGADADFWRTAGTLPASYDGLNAVAFFTNNVIPVTLGNLIGGVVCVGLVYWFVYRRPEVNGGGKT